MLAPLYAALALSATEICRNAGGVAGDTQFPSGINASDAQCLLCNDTAATPPRPNTVYLVNGACSWTTPTAGTVNVGKYTLATGQHLVSLPWVRSAQAEIIVGGALTAAAPGSGIHHINLTAPFVARGKSVAGLVVEYVHVYSEETAVLILNSGKDDTIDATNTRIDHVTGDGNATVGMVHATGPGITIDCTHPHDLVAVQTFMPTDAVTVSPSCRVLNLTALFDVLGSAVTNAMYNVPPPEWLLSIQAFNVKGTGWLILLTTLYFVAKPQKQKED